LLHLEIGDCLFISSVEFDITIFRYYKGEKKAPVLTLVIGGNHEASNYMQELPYGGWLAPNIYYMGKSTETAQMGWGYLYFVFIVPLEKDVSYVKVDIIKATSLQASV